MRFTAPPTITISIDCLEEVDFVALPGSENDPDFVDQPLHPDFSAEGEPIYFGIGLGLSCPANVDCSNISTPTSFDVDNWEVLVRPPMSINAGLNDAWFNPMTDGQGFFINVFPDLGVMALAWFTYDTEQPDEDLVANLGHPGHRWLTALGETNSCKTDMDISITSGGLFDTATEVARVNDGTITLTFHDCLSGLVEYDIPSIDKRGAVPIKRIANDNVALCEVLSEE